MFVLHTLGGVPLAPPPREVPTEIGRGAAWRRTRRTMMDLATHILVNVGMLNPLFSIPFLNQDVLRIDWLHCMDLGAGADFLGGVLWVCMQKMPGANVEARADSMWQDIQRYYAAHGINNSCLHGFVPTTVRPKASKPPKLRASAGVVRHLIPYSKELVDRFCTGGDPQEMAMRAGAHSLCECYMALRTDSIFKKDTLHDHSILFCLQYSFLHRNYGQVWRMKPKTHLFLELGLEAAAGGQPETCWTYRDEDFGGTCAHFARRRGAPCTVPGFSHAVITRFMQRRFIYVN